MKFTEKELKGFWSFLVETFEFTEEQNDAIDHQIPMTQELFDSIMDRCMELGSDVDGLFLRLINEYEEFSNVYTNRILEEVKAVKLPEWTEEEKAIQKDKLYARIRAKYGEDAI